VDQPASISLTDEDCRVFNHDGFLVVPNLLDPAWVAPLHRAFDHLFSGDFETGTAPDEVNWQEKNGDPTLTRQICNGWKADRRLANVVLNETIGAAIARLGDWPGARLIQDNVLWKPPGAGTVGFHRDNAYLAWYTPQEMLSCWIALDDTSEDGGTLELARGSHRWNRSEDQTDSSSDSFHNPDNYLSALTRAADRNNVTLDLVRPEIPRGGCIFHHGWTWHGSGVNHSDRERRALVVHAARSDAHYVPDASACGNGPVYSRYRPLAGDEMPENYFPVVWREDGYRTPGIEAFLKRTDSRHSG